MPDKKDQRHRQYSGQVRLIAEELGYNAIFDNTVANKPGWPDLILKNPKNNRIAVVEVEVTFQQQKSHVEKMGRRWKELQRLVKNSKAKSGVILVVGARRRDLISVCSRAKIPRSELKYGKIIFSCVSYSDQNEIRVSLLRCLGDE